MRCFIALPAPDEVRRRLVGLQAEVASFGRLRMVAEGNIHITLKFLGEISGAKAGEVESALDSISGANTFLVSVEGVGVFPKPDYARVVWAGVGEGFSDVVGLQKRLDGVLAALGFERDGKFHPHYTIARVNDLSDKVGLKRFLSENEGKAFGSYTADRVELMESRLSPKGPAYSVLKSVALK